MPKRSDYDPVSCESASGLHDARESDKLASIMESASINTAVYAPPSFSENEKSEICKLVSYVLEKNSKDSGSFWKHYTDVYALPYSQDDEDYQDLGPFEDKVMLTRDFLTVREKYL